MGRNCLMIITAIFYPPVAIAIHRNKCGKEMCCSILLSFIPVVGTLYAILYAIKVIGQPNPQVHQAPPPGPHVGDPNNGGPKIAPPMIIATPPMDPPALESLDDCHPEEDPNEPPPWEVPPAAPPLPGKPPIPPEAPALPEKPEIPDSLPETPKPPTPPATQVMPPTPEPPNDADAVEDLFGSDSEREGYLDGGSDDEGSGDEGSKGGDGSEDEGSGSDAGSDDGGGPDKPWDGEFYESPRGDGDLPPAPVT